MMKNLDELTRDERARLRLEDPILYAMHEDGIAITRENYVEFNWGEQPEPWTAEHGRSPGGTPELEPLRQDFDDGTPVGRWPG